MSVDLAVTGFEPGRRGVLFDTPVEVLGWARWRTHDGYVYHEVTLRTEDAERWTLELDAGHVLLTRDVPKGTDFGDPTVHVDGTKVTLDGTKRWVWPMSYAQLEHVEGEYWKDLEPGDTLAMRMFVQAPSTMSASREIEDEGEPWEWHQGIYVDRKVIKQAFELPAEEQKDSLGDPIPGATTPVLPPEWFVSEPHPARPYPYRAWARVMPTLFLVAGIVGVVAAIMFGGEKGTKLFDESIVLDAPQGETVLGFFDSDKEQTIGIQLNGGGLEQDWLYTQVLLGPVPPEGADEETFDPKVFAKFDSELSYYSGYDGEAWVEDETRKSEGFRVGKGTYLVQLAFERDTRRAAYAMSHPTLRVSIVSGYRSTLLMWVWSGICLVVALFMWLAKRSHWNKVLVEAGLREEWDD